MQHVGIFCGGRIASDLDVSLSFSIAAVGHGVAMQKRNSFVAGDSLAEPCEICLSRSRRGNKQDGAGAKCEN